MRKRILANPSRIVRLWAKNGIPLSELMNRFHVCYHVLLKLITGRLTANEFARIKHSHLVKGGIRTRFKPGQPSWNKGIHFYAGGHSIETQFKPGHIRGDAARRYKAVGSITIRHWLAKNKGKGRRRKIPYRYIKIKGNESFDAPRMKI
jgi:hypothetical protein